METFKLSCLLCEFSTALVSVQRLVTEMLDYYDTWHARWNCTNPCQFSYSTVLTGVGFLVGVVGFRSILASSSGAWPLLPFVVSPPLTARVWLLLILPQHCLTLSGPRWAPVWPVTTLSSCCLTLLDSLFDFNVHSGDETSQSAAPQKWKGQRCEMLQNNRAGGF